MKRVYDLYIIYPNNINIKKAEKPCATLLRINRRYDISDNENKDIREKFKWMTLLNAIIFLKSNRRKLQNTNITTDNINTTKPINENDISTRDSELKQYFNNPNIPNFNNNAANIKLKLVLASA